MPPPAAQLTGNARCSKFSSEIDTNRNVVIVFLTGHLLPNMWMFLNNPFHKKKSKQNTTMAWTCFHRWSCPFVRDAGKVCGPDSNPQTFNSYCDMLIALCIRQGGASLFRPPTSVVAKPGECSPTTTPLPETTLRTYGVGDLSTCTYFCWHCEACTAFARMRTVGAVVRMRCKMLLSGREGKSRTSNLSPKWCANPANIALCYFILQHLRTAS